MKILYISPLVAGFQDILEGKENSKGLPSFIYPLKKLMDDGNRVDIVLISNYNKKIDIKVDWINNRNIIANINHDFADVKGLKRWIRKFKSLVELYSTLTKAMKYGEYDFVYCHGTAAYLGNVLANYYKLRCGYRVYGVVNVAHDIRNAGVLRSIIRYPIYYAIFNTPKDFLLITDDGTNGDEAFRSYNPQKTIPMYYLLNGVDKCFRYIKQGDVLLKCGCKKGEYIFHAGRISQIKRQDRVVEVLHKLHLSNCKMHLLLAGHISDKVYYNRLMLQIERYDLQDYVHFLGPIERENMQSLAHDAMATVLLGDSSNQGNVFWECAIAEALIITYPEKSLKKYIKHEESGFFVNDEDEAKNVLTRIVAGQYDIKQMTAALKKTVNDKLQTWEERAQFEIDLICKKKGENF